MHPEPVTHPVAPPPARRWYGPLLAGDLAALWPAIVVAFLGVLVIAFAMSYHGLFLFGERIMRWPQYLCIVAPIGLDVFSLVGLLATFLTRDARWRVRAYTWAAFGITVALSVAGNMISAYSLLDGVAVGRGEFVWGYEQVSAVSGAAVWPALSAVALHVLIVVRRHLDERRDKIQTAVARVNAEQDLAELRKARALILATEGATVPDILEDLFDGGSGDVTRDVVEEWVEEIIAARSIKLAAAGASATDILEDLGLDEVKRRTVERWTKPIRDALTGRPAGLTSKTPPRRDNGRRATATTDSGTVPASR